MNTLPARHPNDSEGKTNGSLVLEPDTLQIGQVPLSQLRRLFLELAEIGMGRAGRF